MARPPLTLPPRWQPPVTPWRRRVQWGAVLVGVALGHAALIGPLQPPMGRAPLKPAAMQVVTLVGAAAVAAPEPAPPPLAEPSPAAPPEAPGPEARAEAPTDEPLADEPPAAAAPDARPAPDDRSAEGAAGSAPLEAVAGTVVTQADIRGPVEPRMPRLVAEAWAEEMGRAASVAAGELPALPPPIYRTEPPARGFRLPLRVEHGERVGRGQLQLDLDEDGGYRAHLQADNGERLLLDWVSTGRFDRAGVAPTRLVERVRGRDARAVNFQRDQGVISFSSNSRALRLMDGAQDRASLLLQLMAIAQGQPGGLRAGQAVQLQVAAGRGMAAGWTFEVTGEEALTAGHRRFQAVRLVREPTQPYDQRVEVWLAPAAGHLPIGLRLTTVPGREPVAMWLDGPLPPAGGD